MRGHADAGKATLRLCALIAKPKQADKDLWFLQDMVGDSNKHKRQLSEGAVPGYDPRQTSKYIEYFFNAVVVMSNINQLQAAHPKGALHQSARLALPGR